jgi:hypothetical protein
MSQVPSVQGAASARSWICSSCTSWNPTGTYSCTTCRTMIPSKSRAHAVKPPPLVSLADEQHQHRHCHQKQPTKAHSKRMDFSQNGSKQWRGKKGQVSKVPTDLVTDDGMWPVGLLCPICNLCFQFESDKKDHFLTRKHLDLVDNRTQLQYVCVCQLGSD